MGLNCVLFSLKLSEKQNRLFFYMFWSPRFWRMVVVFPDSEIPCFFNCSKKMTQIICCITCLRFHGEKVRYTAFAFSLCSYHAATAKTWACVNLTWSQNHPLVWHSLILCTLTKTRSKYCNFISLIAKIIQTVENLLFIQFLSTFPLNAIFHSISREERRRNTHVST